MAWIMDERPDKRHKAEGLRQKVTLQARALPGVDADGHADDSDTDVDAVGNLDMKSRATQVIEGVADLLPVDDDWITNEDNDEVTARTAKLLASEHVCVHVTTIAANRALVAIAVLLGTTCAPPLQTIWDLSSSIGHRQTAWRRCLPSKIKLFVSD